MSSHMHLNYKQVFTLKVNSYGGEGKTSNSKLDQKIKTLNLLAIIGGPIVGLIKLVIIIGNAYFYPKDPSNDQPGVETIHGERTFGYLSLNAIRALGDCVYLGIIFTVIDVVADKI